MSEEPLPSIVVASFVGYPGLSLDLVYGDGPRGEVGGRLAVLTARYPERERVHVVGSPGGRADRLDPALPAPGSKPGA